MFGKKKINLLPGEYKSKIISCYLILSGACTGGIVLAIILGMLLNVGILNLSIKNLNKQNTEYNTTKVKISDLEKQIESNQKFLTEQEKSFFSFYSFMSYLESCKPEGLTIISLESLDRMVLPEKKEENSDTASVQTDENADSTQKADEQTGGTSGDKKKTSETAENQENAADTQSPENAEEKKDKKDKDLVTYENDLSGEKIVLRCFAKNTQDISAYIYKLSGMPEITNITLSGIEEQVFNNSEKITIFEAVLEVQ